MEHLQGSGEFCRLLIHGPEDELLVDLAMESGPGMPPTASVAGPIFAPEELAGRKLIAPFDRAAARDFVDVYSLVRIFGKRALLAQAPKIDLGFDAGPRRDGPATSVKSLGNAAHDRAQHPDRASGPSIVEGRDLPPVSEPR